MTATAETRNNVRRRPPAAIKVTDAAATRIRQLLERRGR